jgi:hypothetical protein
MAAAHARGGQSRDNLATNSAGRSNNKYGIHAAILRAQFQRNQGVMVILPVASDLACAYRSATLERESS